MSDAVAAKKLAVIDTIKDGLTIGIKNIGPILVNVLLWLVTIWIPYLNVGTTIGLMIGIVTKASKGEGIPMTEVFDPKYRKYMGEYFLTSGLVGMGVGVGVIFGIIPGIVISLAWCMAILLVVDKGKNPTEALVLSNNCTYGYKWKMFGIYFLVMVAFSIVSFIFKLIPILGIILVLAASLFIMVVIIGLQASIYKQLTANV
jgi:predicted membrane metal-binding protein